MKSLLRTMAVGLPVVLAAVAATQASATAMSKCPGSFQTLGSYRYTDSSLTVANTTCAAGKKLARKLPPIACSSRDTSTGTGAPRSPMSQATTADTKHIPVARVLRL
jgi:hypothetical protein